MLCQRYSPEIIDKISTNLFLIRKVTLIALMTKHFILHNNEPLEKIVVSKTTNQFASSVHRFKKTVLII